jgi:DNA (cytosine-5)-methyltransferase 3A
MTVLSLFDGISAARVALDRAGIKVDRYYASEIKPHAIKIAQSMFPDTVQLGDVNKIDFYALPPVDLLIFGSPCQDLSCANNEQKGLEGERSGLFYKAVEAIRICKPRWFLMENVASMKPGEKEKISRALGEFYTNDLVAIYCEPVRINSSLVSAQMRDRLYWCNWNVTQPKDRKLFLKDVLERGGEAQKEKSYALTATYKKDSSFRRQRTMIEQHPHGYNKGGFFTDNDHVVTNPEKSLALTANYGKMNEKNFAKGQGQLVSIALKDKAPCVSTEVGGFTNYFKEHGYAATQNANGGGQGARTGLYLIGNIESNAQNPNRMGKRVYDPSGKSATLLSPQTGGNTNENYKIGGNVRKLTPRECCRIQTYDERVFDLFSTERPPQKHKVLEVIKLGKGKSAVIMEKEINPDWIEWHKTPHPPYMSKTSFYNVFGDSFTVDVIVHILKCNREMMSQ